MYTTTNFKSKKALKDALTAGKQIGIFQPGPFGGKEPSNGKVYLEGPHFPELHRWYAEAWIENGVLVKVK